MQAANYVVETYKEFEGRPYRVLVQRITSPDQVLTSGEGSLHVALHASGLSATVGIYFYRFAQLDDAAPAFTKIGAASRSEGVGMRKTRGWLYATSASDSYRRKNSAGVEKGIYADVQMVSHQRPMYFVYYEFDEEAAFPEIDEIEAFRKHYDYFGWSTNNQERVNTHPRLGRKIVWHSGAFEDVLALKLPSGKPYLCIAADNEAER